MLYVRILRVSRLVSRTAWLDEHIRQPSVLWASVLVLFLGHKLTYTVQARGSLFDFKHAYGTEENGVISRLQIEPHHHHCVSRLFSPPEAKAYAIHPLSVCEFSCRERRLDRNSFVSQIRSTTLRACPVSRQCGSWAKALIAPQQVQGAVLRLQVQVRWGELGLRATNLLLVDLERVTIGHLELNRTWPLAYLYTLGI